MYGALRMQRHRTGKIFITMNKALIFILLCAFIGFGAVMYIQSSRQVDVVTVQQPVVDTKVETNQNPPTEKQVLMSTTTSVTSTSTKTTTKQDPKPVVIKPTPVPAPVSKSKIHRISAENYVFSPAALTVKEGDTVIWTNGDDASHTITSDSGTELALDYFKKGESVQHTFTKKGIYEYHCEPHPFMKAVITVE